MRLSEIQKKVLFILYHIQSKGVVKPMPSGVLLKFINENSEHQVACRNFRTSCHTLKANGLIRLLRSEDLSLNWLLTESGFEKAKPIYEARIQDKS